MSNQLSGKLVNVDSFEIVELLSLEIEDSRATDDRDMNAAAIEDVSVHKIPISPSAPNFYEPVAGFIVNCMSSASSTFKTVSNDGLNSPLNDL
jgi:hypothetical protein